MAKNCGERNKMRPFVAGTSNEDQRFGIVTAAQAKWHNQSGERHGSIWYRIANRERSQWLIRQVIALTLSANKLLVAVITPQVCVAGKAGRQAAGGRQAVAGEVCARQARQGRQAGAGRCTVCVRQGRWCRGGSVVVVQAAVAGRQAAAGGACRRMGSSVVQAGRYGSSRQGRCGRWQRHGRAWWQVGRRQ